MFCPAVAGKGEYPVLPLGAEVHQGSAAFAFRQNEGLESCNGCVHSLQSFEVVSLDINLDHADVDFRVIFDEGIYGCYMNFGN